MPDSLRGIDRLARHVGGTRVLALPLLRVLAVLAGFAWVLAAPASSPGWRAVTLTVLGFFDSCRLRQDGEQGSQR